MKRYRPARSEYRARSHESAHDASATGYAADSHHPQVPVHPLIPRGDAEMIATADGLRSLVERLRAAGRFAYDSEFIGELTYVPKLCLIQVACAERVSLIDPLAKMDLAPFWELLCDRGVEKVVHAGAQDLEPVFRHMNCAPANVFDTQVACGFIGMTYPVALGKMVREFLGVPLGKGLTFTHWDQRPLSPMQLRYAADDVRYLIAARDQIGRRLDDLGHAAWAAEECRTLCDPALYQFDPEHQYRKVRGATSLNPAGLAILRELVIWRDATARAHDLPPRAFLKDEILLDLARNPVKSVDKLAKIKGLPRPVELVHGGEIVEAITRAAAIPHAQLPSTRQREETPVEKFRADALWTATEAICFGRGIDPNLVASRQEIGALYRHLTAAAGADGGDVAAPPEQDVRMLSGWRREAVGQTIIAMVEGKRAAHVGWENGALRTTIVAAP